MGHGRRKCEADADVSEEINSAGVDGLLFDWFHRCHTSRCAADEKKVPKLLSHPAESFRRAGAGGGGGRKKNGNDSKARREKRETRAALNLLLTLLREQAAEWGRADGRSGPRRRPPQGEATESINQ